MNDRHTAWDQMTLINKTLQDSIHPFLQDITNNFLTHIFFSFDFENSPIHFYKLWALAEQHVVCEQPKLINLTSRYTLLIIKQTKQK